MKNILSLLLLSLVTFAHSQILNVNDFGAIGDGLTDNTASIQRAIDEASRQKCTLVFPSGTYATGMILLKSNITIDLQVGATWTAVPNLDLFPQIKSGADLSQSAGYTMSIRAFIFGDEVENVTLQGQGLIYPAGDRHDVFPDHESNGSKRPYGVYFRKSKNINIENIRLQSSAFWMLRAYLCDDVKVTGVKIFNHANTNNDGIDIVDCHRVHISDCTVDASDDAISLKSEAPRGCEDVTITNCIVSSTASYIKLGTGSFGAFKRIVVSNCTLKPTEADTVVHILQFRNGITGLSLMSSDGADIENVSFSNIVMDGMLTPIFVRLGDRHRVTHQEYSGEPMTAGTINNISYSNITATNCGPVPINMTGYPDHYVTGVSINNSSFSFAEAGTSEDLEVNIPENSKGYPFPKMYGTNLPASGIYMRHVKNVSLDHLTLNPASGDPRPVILLDDVINLRGSEVLVNHKLATKKALKILNSNDISINK